MLILCLYLFIKRTEPSTLTNRLCSDVGVCGGFMGEICVLAFGRVKIRFGSGPRRPLIPGIASSGLRLTEINDGDNQFEIITNCKENDKRQQLIAIVKGTKKRGQIDIVVAQ